MILAEVAENVLPCPHCNGTGLARAKKSRREVLYTRLMKFYGPYLIAYPEPPFREVLSAKYGVEEVRLMTIEEVADLVAFLERKMQGESEE